MPNILYDALFAGLDGREGPLLHMSDGRQISGSAFHGLLTRAAVALSAAGVVKGDRVAVQIAKSPQALAIYGATVALGAVFLPLNTAYTASEIDYFLGNATPRIFLCDPAHQGKLAGVADQHGARLLTLDGAGMGTLADRMLIMPDHIEPVSRLVPEDGSWMEFNRNGVRRFAAG